MYNHFGYQKIQQVGENYLTFYRSFLMKKVKLLSLFLALTLILGCFVGCNGTKNPDDDDADRIMTAANTVSPLKTA